MKINTLHSRKCQIARESNDANTLSKQAREFLKDNYQFFEQIKQLEEEKFSDSKDLSDSHQLLELLESLEREDNTGEVEYESSYTTYTGSYGSTDKTDAEINEVYYREEDDGKLSLNGYFTIYYFASLLGPATGGSWYEPPTSEHLSVNIADTYGFNVVFDRAGEVVSYDIYFLRQEIS